MVIPEESATELVDTLHKIYKYGTSLNSFFCALLIVLTIDAMPETGMLKELEIDNVGMWPEYHIPSLPVLCKLAASHAQHIALVILDSVNWY